MANATETTRVVPLTCHGHSRPVTHIDFSSIDNDEQYYLISACKDNNPMLRDGVTGDWIGTFIGHKGAVWQARISSDATLAATGSADFTAKVWDTHTGETTHTLQHSHIVRTVAFPPGARPQILATGGMEKKLRIFDLSLSTSSSESPGTPAANGSTPPSPPTMGAAAAGSGTATPIAAAAAAPASSNGGGAGGSSAPFYELGAGVHGGAIRSIVWTPDANVLATASEDRAMRWWDLRARRAVAEVALDGAVGTCELDRGGGGGAAGATLSVAAGQTVYFFDAERPATLVKKVVTPYQIASVACNGAARRFITGSPGDTWVRVWDLDEEKEVEVGKGHHGPIWACKFSPDGKLYATGSEDGTIKLWKFTSGPYGLWR